MAKHVLRKWSLMLMDPCLRLEASANKLAVGALQTLADCSELAKRFPSQSRTLFDALIKASSGSSLSEFHASLRACAELCQLRLKPLDKKDERQLFLGHRQGFLEQMATTADPALALHAVTVAAFAMSAEVILFVPSRVFPALIDAHAALLPPELAQRLVELWNTLPVNAQAVADALPALREAVAQSKKRK